MKSIYSGKVREVFDVGNNRLIMLTTDRISAFDVIMPTPIPNKGIILTKLSEFWFDFTKDIVKNHIISMKISDYPPELQNQEFQDRSMLVKKLNMIMIECTVSGYLTGSCYKSYRNTGGFCGNALVAGMLESQKLSEPIFCTSTKAEAGKHDVYITFDQAKIIASDDTMEKLKDISLKIYTKCAEYALSRGIIVADTKFEFGIDEDGEIVLGDELLTPDSSRFWPANDYTCGVSQKSFDKQYLRDWLLEQGLAGAVPAPQLPKEVCDKTAEKYVAAYKALLGKDIIQSDITQSSFSAEAIHI